MSTMQVPTSIRNKDGDIRRVGIEIEFAGLGPRIISKAVTDVMGGDVQWTSPFLLHIHDTSYGKFTIELDSKFLKDIGHQSQVKGDETFDDSFEAISMRILSRVASEIVPWEVVSPPIPMDDLAQFNRVIVSLRDSGAKGTRHSLQYAFGLHLNPELPDMRPETILRYFRAFLCLYDAIIADGKVDPVRRITPYINHFDRSYIAKVIDENYNPTQEQMIDDYLKVNATRNRSMDLLPLFLVLDEERVRAATKDVRINPRPTFHFRLLDCDIDNPSWDISVPWRIWMMIENLAENRELLDKVCKAYTKELSRITHPIERRWRDRVLEMIDADEE